MTTRLRNGIGVALVLLIATATVAPDALLAKKGKKGGKGSRVELNGVVHGQSENPLPGASVRLTAPDGSVVLETTADDEGSFSVQVAEAGTYSLRVGHADYATWETPLELNLNEAYNLTFKLVDVATANKQEAIKAFNRGADALKTGTGAEAQPHFLRAAELDPQLAEAHLALTDLYMGTGQLDEAAAAIERFLVLRPDDVSGHRIAYQVYAQQGNTARAEERLNSLVGTEFAKPLAASIYNEGVAATQAGDDEGARLRFQRAVTLDPTLEEPLAGLATLAYNAGDYAAAEAALDRLQGLDATNEQGLRLRFLIHDAQAETDAALAAFDAYHAVAPEAALALVLERAEMDFRDGNTAPSQKALEHILTIDPDQARAHHTLGLIYFQSNPAKARAHLERFIALAPDDPEVASAREMLRHL